MRKVSCHLRKGQDDSPKTSLVVSLIPCFHSLVVVDYAIHTESKGGSRMSEQLLMAEEVAALLRVPVEHVYRLARRRELPSVRLGRYVRFTNEGVNSYIKKNVAGVA